MATLNSGESFGWMSRYLMNVNFQVWFFSLHLFVFWCFWWQWLVERHIQSIMFCYVYSSQFTAISSAFSFVFNFHLSALTQKLLTWWFGIFFPPVLRRLPFTSDNWRRIWELLSLYVHATWCFLKTCVGNEGALSVRAWDKSKGRKRRTPLKWHFRYVSDIQILMWFLFTSQELVFTCL